MEQLMLGLLMWLGAHSNYSIPDYLPAVEYKTGEELWNIRYGNVPKEEGLDKILGLFHSKRGKYGTVYLNKNFDPSKKEHQMILLHELVHFLQFSNKAKFACESAKEPEAYDLTKLWLKENNMPFPFDEATIHILGLCM